MTLTSVSTTSQHITALVFLFLTSTVSCSMHYSTHCSSFVPESTARHPESTTFPFTLNQDGFFTGGDGIHPSSSEYYNPSNDRRSLLFVTHNVYTTNVEDIYKVHATLVLQFYAMSYYYAEDVAYSYSYSPEVLEEASASGPWRFTFEGFWSKSSGKLCMLGSTKFRLPNGNIRLLDAVLKLSDITTPNTITNLVRGTMHSLSSVGDAQYFEPMNLLMFPKMNYKYSVGVKESGHSCSGGIDVSKSDSLGLPLSVPICSIFASQEVNSFDLEYIHECSSESNCNPLGEGVGFLPRLMSLSLVQCSNDRRSMRFLLQFPNRNYVSYNEPFVPSTTLVAEGSWDATRNHLCVVACRFLDAESLSTSRIEDCSIRMSLRFPAFWSIGNTDSVVGNIWSVKPSNIPGYFSMISFKIQYPGVPPVPGLRYNYTLVDKARILCPKNFPSPNRRNQYPDENSNEWRFDMSFPNSSQINIGWGNSEPIFIGDRHVSNHMNPFSGSGNAKTNVEQSKKKQLKMSHRMMFPFYDAFVGDHTTVGFIAEGIYDTETGELCMVGCRFLNNNQKSTDKMECENLVKLKFPPLDSRDHIQGRLECKREESDPLYYEPVIFSAISPYQRIGRQVIKRMDAEMIMSLMSSTLVCAFVACQIFYLKKNPGVITSISLLMLVILTFGQMIPMITSFDALLSTEEYEIFPRRTAGRLEVNEVILKFLTLMAFLFQFRLLQMVWSERSPVGNEKVAFWTAEKKTFCVSMLLYVCGGLAALSAHWKNYKFIDDKKNYGHGGNGNQYLLWKDLQSYYGLVMDGFLLPQILLNTFCNTREVALSPSFYLGITLVQMLPHAYDLHRVQYLSKDFDWSYKYANPSTDYYSAAWDVSIVVGTVVFAAMLHLQQQFGGRFFLPRRFREREGYDKLPVQSEA